MRCVDCQKDTVSPHRHCECCGRELASAAASTESSPAADVKPAGVRTCAICGAPSGDGECCDKCFNSLDAWVAAGPAAAPAAEPIAPPPTGKTDQIDALWSEMMNTPAPPRSEFVAVEPSPKPVAPVLAPRVPSPQVNTLAPQVQLPSQPQAAPPVLPSAPNVPVVHAEPIKIEPPPPVAVPRAEPVASVAPRNAPKPPAVVHSRPKSRSKNLWALPSAIAVLGAVVYGGYWLQANGYLSDESKPEATVAVKERARDPQPAQRSAERASTPARNEPAPRPAKSQGAAPRPAAKQASTVAKARPANVPAPAPIPAASVAVPAVVTTLPEPPPPVASTAPSTAPQGPFFEPTQVNEAPRVASRVAPDVPAELRGNARNEIVIVRMLVSHIGRPSRVSLLRKSKAGPRVDDAVIAAVNQWTFSPARRKGEAVSSWFNIGIPVLAD